MNTFTLRGNPELFAELAIELANTNSPLLQRLAVELEDQLDDNAERDFDFADLREMKS